MEAHDVASIFPMMNEDEYQGLRRDIEAKGQREPVWTYQGKVIDGRNRLRACMELGITPKTREWDGKGSLVEFVVSLNLHRRHLNSGQRAMCADEAKERIAKEIADEERQRKQRVQAEIERKKREVVASPPPENRKPDERTCQSFDKSAQDEPTKKAISRDAKKEAAALFGTNHQYIADAQTVRSKAPDLAEKVKSGEITLPQAKREVARQEKRTDLEAKAKAVEAAPPSIHPSWEITEGDCVEVLTTLAPGSVRLVFADPPYNIGVDYGNGPDADRLDQDDFLDWSQSWIDAAAKLLAPDGSMWVLINDEWADLFGVMLRDAGLHRRSWIKWYESFGINNTGNFNRCSRHLFYCVKDPKRFVFHGDAVSRPSDRQLKYQDKRADPGGKLWDNVWGINPPIPRLVDNHAERLPDFPTQLPLALLLPIVGCASDPGDLVLDPFNGSGTTGAAAIRLGRRYRGIEKSPQFASMARLRLTAEKGPIHGSA
jgi:DNA modification methylase